MSFYFLQILCCISLHSRLYYAMTSVSTPPPPIRPFAFQVFAFWFTLHSMIIIASECLISRAACRSPLIIFAFIYRRRFAERWLFADSSAADADDGWWLFAISLPILFRFLLLCFVFRFSQALPISHLKCYYNVSLTLFLTHFFGICEVVKSWYWVSSAASTSFLLSVFSITIIFHYIGSFIADSEWSFW